MEVFVLYKWGYITNANKVTRYLSNLYIPTGITKKDLLSIGFKNVRKPSHRVLYFTSLDFTEYPVEFIIEVYCKPMTIVSFELLDAYIHFPVICTDTCFQAIYQHMETFKQMGIFADKRKSKRN